MEYPNPNEEQSPPLQAGFVGAYLKDGETRIVPPRPRPGPGPYPPQPPKFEPHGRGQPQPQGSYLKILLFYLNACYFIGIIPFRIERTTDPECSGFKMSFTKFQNWICGIIHGLFVTYAVYKVRWMNPIQLLQETKGRPEESTTIFTIVLAIIEICYMLTLIYVFWQKSQALTFVSRNYPSSSTLPPSRNQSRRESRGIHQNPEIQKIMRIKAMLLRTNLGSFLLFGIFTAIGVRDFLDEYLEEPDIEEYLKERAVPLFFFLGSKFQKLPNFIQLCLCGIYVLSSLLYGLMLNYGNLFFLILALLSYDIGHHFLTRLENKELSVCQVLETYEKTKRIIQEINEEYGLLTLFFVLTSIPYYANLFPDFLHDTEMGIDRRFVIGWNLAVMSVVLFLTTGMADKIKRFQEWLSKPENANQLSPNHLANLREEVKNDLNIGLSANGFFVVSYASVGRILQLLVTYGLIAAETGYLPSLQNITGIDSKLLDDIKDSV